MNKINSGMKWFWDLLGFEIKLLNNVLNFSSNVTRSNNLFSYKLWVDFVSDRAKKDLDGILRMLYASTAWISNAESDLCGWRALEYSDPESTLDVSCFVLN